MRHRGTVQVTDYFSSVNVPGIRLWVIGVIVVILIIAVGLVLCCCRRQGKIISYSEVSCVFRESCILPCSFQGGTDVVIHWTQVTAGDLHVHSFYHNQDQLAYQVQRFRDRTSLFKDQISRGNASLQLTGVKVQDQGRYKCHTSVIRGNKDSINILFFFAAPVDQVDLQQVENRITCSSEGIYPEPELTWSTSPPSNLNLQHKTTKQKTEQLLYNIRSYLILSDSDLGYSCTVSTRRNRKRATLWRLSKHKLCVFSISANVALSFYLRGFIFTET
uniref:Ig-like domain-containing protein n=1 Tax=Seriola lalandi dorsalis TaxID=1841481 RepID=A0A3B4YRU0_SERLL